MPGVLPPPTTPGMTAGVHPEPTHAHTHRQPAPLPPLEGRLPSAGVRLRGDGPRVPDYSPAAETVLGYLRPRGVGVLLLLLHAVSVHLDQTAGGRPHGRDR